LGFFDLLTHTLRNVSKALGSPEMIFLANDVAILALQDHVAFEQREYGYCVRSGLDSLIPFKDAKILF
jgi:hypothetical protein